MNLQNENEKLNANTSRIKVLATRFCKIFLIIHMSFLSTFLLMNTAAFSNTNDIEGIKKIGKAFASVAKKVSPAVVFIHVEKSSNSTQSYAYLSPFNQENEFPDFFRHLFPNLPNQKFKGRKFPNRHKRRPKMHGQGSGFIISRDGHILTNNHVIGDAEKIIVKLLDGREYTAKKVGVDSHSDVAVIKIKAKNLPTLDFGDSNSLEVGEWVIAVGNPFGLSHTLTAGIVSAKGRSSVGITNYENFIQTDAAINPGNSGGPLINLEGKAIGMNTAIFSRSGGYMGIGFAIPINMIKNIKDQLIDKGSVTRGYLGIMIQNLTSDLAKSFNVKNTKGVLIADVTPGSPAEKSGLKQGDLILKFDHEKVSEVGSFRNKVALTDPGVKKELLIIRDGKKKKMKITIGSLPQEDQLSMTKEIGNSIKEKLGFVVENITTQLLHKYGFSKSVKGILITEVDPNSLASEIGIKSGSVILKANKKLITNIDDFKKAIRNTPKHGNLLLLIKDGNYSRYVTLPIG